MSRPAPDPATPAAATPPDEPGVLRARAMFPQAPFVAHLGMRLLTLTPGHCETELPLRPHLLQHTGVAHAGVITTLADHSAGIAAQAALRSATGVVLTAELKLSLLRPAAGQALHCVAQVIKPGRQLMFTEAEVHAIDGGTRTLVARLSATMAVVDKP